MDTKKAKPEMKPTHPAGGMVEGGLKDMGYASLGKLDMGLHEEEAEYLKGHVEGLNDENGDDD